MAARASAPPPIAVLCSGSGTNLQAIIRAATSGRLKARIAVVVCDRADAYALVRARRAGIEARYVDRRAFSTRAAFEQAIIALLNAHRVRAVCLAGYMRILSPRFVRAFPHRILNIHPALLPAFPGGQAIRDVLAWGAKITGVTVHLVDEQVDHGPIVVQEAVPIRADETEAQLLARVHRVEHRLYPRAIQWLIEGRLRVQGRVVRVGRRTSRRRAT